MTEFVKLMRVHQWVKNGFVFAPLFFTPHAIDFENIVRVSLGALAFCLFSSSVYILNDYKDREADRQHPSKRTRPLASGTVSVPAAFGLMAGLLVVGIALGASLSSEFLIITLLYLALNVAYSMGLKHVAIIDVMIIALGFVMRIQAGAELIAIDNSAWIVMCTFMLALFLAIAKRRDDIVRKLAFEHRRSLEGYTRRYLDIALAVTLSAVLISYMIYTADSEVAERLGTEQLYLTLPFVTAAVLRYLQITFVEERSGSPTTLVLTDRFLLVCMAGWVATFAALIYL